MASKTPARWFPAKLKHSLLFQALYRRQVLYCIIIIDHNTVMMIGKPALLYDETSPDWAPCLHLGYANNYSSDSAVKRYERAQKRKAISQVELS